MRHHKKEEVSYLHSIVGVEEEYINECKKTNRILGKWKNTDCFIDEKINRINLQLATSGENGVLEMVKSELNKWNRKPWKIMGYDKIKHAYITGHGNINLTIPETNVATLLVLLLKGGFITHQNGVYGNGVYNIESSILIKEENWVSVKEQEVKGNNRQNEIGRGWCRDMLKMCAQYLAIEQNRADESLYSYFQALMQTLNTLDQYELFGISRDIFDLIFPSFEMFFQKMKKAIFAENQNKNCLELELAKESMWNYLESVNSVIYHTIHTDQIYLMIPGYSGTSFSIPIKLSLFYSWFMEKVIQISNDGKRMFSYILTPVTESKPKTRAITMSGNEKDILIYVRLSRRSLYLKCPDKMFHAKDIENPLVSICTKLLSGTGIGVRVSKAIYEIPSDIMAYVEKEKTDYVASMRYIWNIQKQVDNNRQLLLVSGELRNMIRTLIEVYQEVFADVFAVNVLNCDESAYRKAFQVSEGTVDKEGRKPIRQDLRERTISQVVFHKQDTEIQGDGMPSHKLEHDIRLKNLLSDAQVDKDFTDRLLNSVWVYQHLCEYAEMCYAKMGEWLESEENGNDVEQIRTVYRMFTSQNHSSSEIYSLISKCIAEYRMQVRDKYEKVIGKSNMAGI